MTKGTATWKKPVRQHGKSTATWKKHRNMKKKKEKRHRNISTSTRWGEHEKATDMDALW